MSQLLERRNAPYADMGLPGVAERGDAGKLIAKCLFVTVGLTHGFSLDLKPLLVASLFVSTNSLSLNLGAPRKVGRPRHFLSQENIDNIVSLYNSGEPTSIIAEQFKVGAQRVVPQVQRRERFLVAERFGVLAPAFQVFFEDVVHGLGIPSAGTTRSTRVSRAPS